MEEERVAEIVEVSGKAVLVILKAPRGHPDCSFWVLCLQG